MLVVATSFNFFVFISINFVMQLLWSNRGRFCWMILLGLQLQVIINDCNSLLDQSWSPPTRSDRKKGPHWYFWQVFDFSMTRLTFNNRKNFNIRNTRKRCGICSKLTIKTPERRHWRVSVDGLKRTGTFKILGNLNTKIFRIPLQLRLQRL